MKSPLIFVLTVFAVIISCKKKEQKVQPEETSTVEKIEKKAKPAFEMLWQTDSVFKTPESCLFDPVRNRIYVSNVNSSPRKKDNNGFISIIGQDSKLNLKWATGMSAPKGMGLYNDILYATDIDAVVEIDVNTGKVLKRHTVKDALMLNDLTVDERDGTVYFSAMDTDRIFTLKGDKIELWMDNIIKPNGLFIDGDLLLVASLGEGTLKAYDLKSKKVMGGAVSGLGKADGIVQLNSGAYVVSDWRGEIFFIENLKATSIYSTKEQNIQTADIGIINGQDVILIPTFFDNRVKAYRLIE